MISYGRGCFHSPLEIISELPPFVWIKDAWIDFSVWYEFHIMEARGFKSYIGERRDKKGNLIASGVVLWRK
jgi:hypothetical protein